jgi:hypothetical protein
LYRCTALGCPSMGRLSGFNVDDRDIRCLYCSNRNKNYLTLLVKAGCSEEETNEQKPQWQKR